MLSGEKHCSSYHDYFHVLSVLLKLQLFHLAALFLFCVIFSVIIYPLFESWCQFYHETTLFKTPCRKKGPLLEVKLFDQVFRYYTQMSIAVHMCV